MANVSNANGSFYISKSAWEGMRPLFTEYNRQYNTPCYGVYSWYVFDGEEEVTIEFAANGRWSLASTMEDPYAIFGAYDNPLGKETFIQGANKGYYKAAKHVLRTSLTRTPEMWMTGYKSKESMEFWRGAGLGLDDN